jgi:hypothetical protein
MVGCDDLFGVSFLSRYNSVQLRIDANAREQERVLNDAMTARQTVIPDVSRKTCIPPPGISVH